MENYYKEKYINLSKAIRTYKELAEERLTKENNKLADYDEGFNDAIELVMTALEEQDNE